MKKRTGPPFMAPDAFGRGLTGFGINLLVPDIDRAMHFQQAVLATTVVYADPDFAVVEGSGGRWLFHADHSYRNHPMHGVVAGLEARGAGIEIRLYDSDPDVVEERARAHDYTVLEGCADKPHGLRECFVIDADGYVWVPSAPLGKQR